MKRLLIATLIIAMIFLVACQPETLKVTSNKGGQASTNNVATPPTNTNWCTAGASYAQGAVQSTIQGFVMFKDTQYCKANARITSSSDASISLNYTYYFSQDGKDIWLIVDSANGTTETHLTS